VLGEMIVSVLVIFHTGHFAFQLRRSFGMTWHIIYKAVICIHL
jgi:hypothetical protein